MNFQVGQVFNKNNNEMCLIELINYDDKCYGLFSIEGTKVTFAFYEIYDTGSNYKLLAITDDNLNNKLLGIFEEMNHDE